MKIPLSKLIHYTLRYHHVNLITWDIVLLQKKRGYHLDLLVATALVGFSALLGFPWILAALVPSLAHVDILTILSPGRQLPSVR